jgi:2-C-methyl-D-erythritol 2,4-cyclodiphosphate synthase
MQKTISAIIETDPDDIAVKATTAEKLGFIGREEGIVAIAVVLLTK